MFFYKKKKNPKTTKQVFFDMIAIISSIFFALSSSAKLFGRSVCSPPLPLITLRRIGTIKSGWLPLLPQNDSCQQGSQGILCDLTHPFCPLLTWPLIV